MKEIDSVHNQNEGNWLSTLTKMKEIDSVGNQNEGNWFSR